MSELRTIFEHLPQFKIIRCKSCQCAVVPSQIERHIKDHHPQITAGERRNISQAAIELSDIAHRQEDVIYPDAGSEPVAGFPIVTDALRCNDAKEGRLCDYTCIAVRTMQQHCKDEHSWRNEQRRGGNTRAKPKHTSNRMWEGGVHCQRFFEYKQWRKVFPVRGGDNENQTEEHHQSTHIAARLVQRAHDIINEAEQREDHSRDHFIADPWMEMTGWHRHLRGFNHASLKAYICPAKGEEDHRAESVVAAVSSSGVQSTRQFTEVDGLAEACRGTRRLIQRAFTTITPERISKATLQQVARKETGGSVNDYREFYSEHNVKTLRNYSSVWVELLRYIWRTADLKERPKYRMTEEQSTRLQRLRHSVVRHDKNEVEEATLSFWIAMFDHEMKDHEYDSAIVSGLAVIAIKRTGEGYTKAIHYTLKLSAVVTVLRGLVVYLAWKQRQADVRQHQSEGMSRQKAEECSRSVDENVKEPVRKFMTLMDFGGVSTPMNHILQQRTYGMAIRNTTKAPATVGWQGDTILIGKIRFTVEDVRKVVFGLWETARRRLMSDLLFVSDPDHGGSSDLPKVDVGTLFDNEAEDVQGWNFLDDSRNHFEVDGTQWLAERMITSRDMRSMLVERVEGGNVVWKDQGVEKYFRAVRRFKEELMVLVHLSAGAPARATELTSIMSRNPMPGRGRRGVIIDDGLVKFVQGYSKKFRSRKELEIVHRYVPEEVGDLVVYLTFT